MSRCDDISARKNINKLQYYCPYLWARVSLIVIQYHNCIKPPLSEVMYRQSLKEVYLEEKIIRYLNRIQIRLTSNNKKSCIKQLNTAM